MRRALSGAAVLAASVAAALTIAAQPSGHRGVQDPAWAPDGRRLATSSFDRIWISRADGDDGRQLRPDSTALERDPAWSPDGRLLAFAADAGEGFDIFVTTPDGRTVRRLTEQAGDERWPSWTRDGRIVYAHRAARLEPWRLHAVASAGGPVTALFADAPGVPNASRASHPMAPGSPMCPTARAMTGTWTCGSRSCPQNRAPLRSVPG